MKDLTLPHPFRMTESSSLSAPLRIIFVPPNKANHVVGFKIETCLLASACHENSGKYTCSHCVSLWQSAAFRYSPSPIARNGGSNMKLVGC